MDEHPDSSPDLAATAQSEERSRRAAAVAAPIQRKISAATLVRLAFDDSPYDYPALLGRPARSPEEH